MTKTAMVRARIEPKLKKDAEQVMEDVGISPTEAIRLFYRHVTIYQGLPFEVRIPNAETRAAITEARSGKKLKDYKNMPATMRSLREELKRAMDDLDARNGIRLRGKKELLAYLRSL